MQSKSSLMLWLAMILLIALSSILSPPPIQAQDDQREDALNVVWSPDGKWIAVSATNGLWMFDAESPELAPQHYFADSVIPVVAFDPVRDRMAIYDDDAHLIHIIEPATGDVIMDLPGEEGPFGLALDLQYSDDGKLLAVAYMEEFTIFDAITGHERRSYSYQVMSIVSGTQQGTMLTGEFTGGIGLYDINDEDFRPQAVYELDDLTSFESIYEFVIFPDTPAIEGVALRGRGLVRFNMTDETSSLFAPEFADEVQGLTINHHADTLAIGTDGKFVLYDLTAIGITHEIVMENDARVFSLAFNPDDSQLVTLDTSGTIQIWDVATGHVLVTWNNFEYAHSQKWG